MNPFNTNQNNQAFGGGGTAFSTPFSQNNQNAFGGGGMQGNAGGFPNAFGNSSLSGNNSVFPQAGANNLFSNNNNNANPGGNMWANNQNNQTPQLGANNNNNLFGRSNTMPNNMFANNQAAPNANTNNPFQANSNANLFRSNTMGGNNMNNQSSSNFFNNNQSFTNNNNNAFANNNMGGNNNNLFNATSHSYNTRSANTNNNAFGNNTLGSNVNPDVMNKGTMNIRHQPKKNFENILVYSISYNSANKEGKNLNLDELRIEDYQVIKANAVPDNVKQLIKSNVPPTEGGIGGTGPGVMIGSSGADIFKANNNPSFGPNKNMFNTTSNTNTVGGGNNNWFNNSNANAPNNNMMQNNNPFGNNANTNNPFGQPAGANNNNLFQQNNSNMNNNNNAGFNVFNNNNQPNTNNPFANNQNNNMNTNNPFNANKLQPNAGGGFPNLNTNMQQGNNMFPNNNAANNLNANNPFQNKQQLNMFPNNQNANNPFAPKPMNSFQNNMQQGNNMFNNQPQMNQMNSQPNMFNNSQNGMNNGFPNMNNNSQNPHLFPNSQNPQMNMFNNNGMQQNPMQMQGGFPMSQPFYPQDNMSQYSLQFYPNGMMNSQAFYPNAQMSQNGLYTPFGMESQYQSQPEEPQYTARTTLNDITARLNNKLTEREFSPRRNNHASSLPYNLFQKDRKSRLDDFLDRDRDTTRNEFPVHWMNTRNTLIKKEEDAYTLIKRTKLVEDDVEIIMKPKPQLNMLVSQTRGRSISPVSTRRSPSPLSIRNGHYDRLDHSASRISAAKSIYNSTMRVSVCVVFGNHLRKTVDIKIYRKATIKDLKLKVFEMLDQMGILKPHAYNGHKDELINYSSLKFDNHNQSALNESVLDQIGMTDGSNVTIDIEIGFANEVHLHEEAERKDAYERSVVNHPVSLKAPLSPQNSYVPILTKPGYVTTPSIETLKRMNPRELAAVTNFSIANEFAKVEFEGNTDVRGVNLDEVVSLERGTVVVYPDEAFQNNKPMKGEKLNKPAIITIYQMFHPSCDYMKAKEKINKMCRKNGLELLDYDHTNGVLRARVNHF